MPPKRRQRAIVAAATALAAALLAAPAANAADAQYDGISSDGSVAFFSTTERLVPGDTDTKPDIYERSYDSTAESYVTREVSIGPTGGNNAYETQYLGADEAGDKVFFSTEERLTAADTDNATDIYARDLSSNTTTLVSAGDPECEETCGNANIDVGAVSGGIVADGKEVIFFTDERLSKQDTDNQADVYARSLETGKTTLVSIGDPSCPGSCGNGLTPAFFKGVSADGSEVVFSTAEAMVSGDTNGRTDLYERNLSTGETKLVSTPGACPVVEGSELDCTPVYEGISSDGSHVFFESNARISTEDTDSKQDVYDWSSVSGTASLASTGTGGEAGNGAHDARYAGSSADGSALFVLTDERLAASDTDSGQDVYVRRGGETELVSEGDGSCVTKSLCDKPASLAWVSPSGSTAILRTEEPLLAEDEDEADDMYSRALPGGPTTLVSRPDSSCTVAGCGNGVYGASFAGASSDGSRIFFSTRESLLSPDPEEPLAPSDSDESTDVYEREGTATKLVSVGVVNGNGAYDAQLRGVSANGARAFFVTSEQLTGEDADTSQDVYMRSAGGTLLVSRGNDEGLESRLAPPAPVLQRTDPASPNVSTEPRVIGSEPRSEAAIKIYKSADCSGAPVAAGSAEELGEAGIVVEVEAGKTTSLRATAEAEGFVSSCSAAISYRQESAPPEEPGEGGGESGGGSEESGGGGSTEGGAGGSGGGETSSPGPIAPSPMSPPPPTYGPGIPYQAPLTRITFGPAFKTRAQRPVFRFVDATGQPGTSFICGVDRRHWRRCASPVRLKGLGRGRHVFRVKAVNAAGVWETKPVTRAFKLVSGGRSRLHKRHRKRGRR